MISKQDLLLQAPLLAETVYFVEATDCETHNFWCDSSPESQYVRYSKEQQVNWKQLHGYFVHVGDLSIIQDSKIKCEAVGVCLTFNKLDGHVVCFYNPSSQYVDHNMVEEALKPFIKQTEDGRLCKCDAMNFHHCLHYIKDLNK